MDLAVAAQGGFSQSFTSALATEWEQPLLALFRDILLWLSSSGIF